MDNTLNCQFYYKEYKNLFNLLLVYLFQENINQSVLS